MLRCSSDGLRGRFSKTHIHLPILLCFNLYVLYSSRAERERLFPAESAMCCDHPLVSALDFVVEGPDSGDRARPVSIKLACPRKL